MAKRIIKFCMLALLMLGQQLSLASEQMPLSAIQQSPMVAEVLIDSACESMPTYRDGDHRLCSSECAGSVPLLGVLIVINHGVTSSPAITYINNPIDPLLSPPDPPPQA